MPPVYPGQRRVNEPELATILAAADAFWDHRNVRAQAPTQVMVADSLAGEDAPMGGLGRGYSGPDPTIFLDSRYVGSRLRNLRVGNPRQRVNAVKSLYGLLTHEDGHARGLDYHTPSGIMDAVTPVVPGDWAALARELGITRFPKRRRGVMEG